MDKLLKNERDFVTPGEKLVDSMEFLPGRNCFREGNGVFAKKTGLLHVSGRVLSVIALNGIYMPQRDDMIIGEVKDVQSNGWVVEVGAPYQAYLPLSGVRGYLDSAKTDLSKVYGVGDMIYGKIKMVSSTQSVHISMFDRMCRKFSGGRIVAVNPAKVPRIIGKSGSMIDMIKRYTGCRVVVGQNGVMWLEGESPKVEDFVINVVETIQEKSHVEGLTSEIEKMLKNSGIKPAVQKSDEKHEEGDRNEKE